MQYEVLRDMILQDLRAIECPINFELVIKDYSSTFFGCFRTRTNRVYLYYYKDKEKTKPYTYRELIETAIHEAVHAQQWHDPNYVRVRGVMHDKQFNYLYEMYLGRRNAVEYEKSFRDYQTSVERVSTNPVPVIKRTSVYPNTRSTTSNAGSVLRVACKRRV